MKIESDVHSKNMIKFAQENEDVLVLSADLGTSCEVKEFPKVFPEKYLSMGIAEQNMLSWQPDWLVKGFVLSYTPLQSFFIADRWIN